MSRNMNRREVLVHATGAVAGVTSTLLAHQTAAQAPATVHQQPFGFCLNTSTIRGQKLSLLEEIELAAQAGYQGIEPWMREIQQYLEGGGTLPDLRKRIADAGLSVESAIGFAEWIVDDDQRRRKGLETARRDMEMLRAIGGKRIAAPPAGATRQADLDLMKAAERYHALLQLGDSLGVVPQLELWGFSQSISRLGELMYVAVESGHPAACLLPDVFHIYKGGSDFAGMKMISGQAIHVFHLNDYPADPPRASIGDADRVYPGDGVAPLASILGHLHQAGFRGMLSLELFNRDYWQQDPLSVAKTGLQKMQDVVQQAIRA